MASGPQTTASWGPFYLRATYLIGSRLDITAGVLFKMGFAWIWSRCGTFGMKVGYPLAWW
jgi:hypothetical protein